MPRGRSLQSTSGPRALPYPTGRAQAGLLGAFQIGALARVHPYFFTLGDELGHLDRHPVRELGGFGARRLRGPSHDGRGLHNGELHDRRKLDTDGTTVQPFHRDVHLGLEPVAVIADGFGVERVLLVTRRIHEVHAALVAVQHLELLGLERRLVHEIGGSQAQVEGVPGDEAAEPHLHERPQVARRAVGEVHHAARLSLDHHDVAGATNAGRRRTSPGFQRKPYSLHCAPSRLPSITISKRSVVITRNRPYPFTERNGSTARSSGLSSPPRVLGSVCTISRANASSESNTSAGATPRIA